MRSRSATSVLCSSPNQLTLFWSTGGVIPLIIGDDDDHDFSLPLQPKFPEVDSETGDVITHDFLSAAQGALKIYGKHMILTECWAKVNRIRLGTPEKVY